MSQKPDAVAIRTDAMLRELAPVYDITLQISVEVGRVSLCVRDLLKLAVDSVIEVKKPAGEPFDICINGMPVARGDVIIVDQLSGVRIVEIHKSAVGPS